MSFDYDRKMEIIDILRSPCGNEWAVDNEKVNKILASEKEMLNKISIDYVSHSDMKEFLKKYDLMPSWKERMKDMFESVYKECDFDEFADASMEIVEHELLKFADETKKEYKDNDKFLEETMNKLLSDRGIK